MEYITIGIIVNTFGLKGVLKVKSFTDFKEERYRKGMTLFILFQQHYVPVTVVQYRSVKGIEQIQFEEFTSINDSEKYKGCELLVSKSDIHVLDEDEFYFDELIGLDVYGETYIGECIDVREVPQGAIFVVQTKNKQVLIPFNKEFVKNVDTTNKRITIIEWEGLL